MFRVVAGHPWILSGGVWRWARSKSQSSGRCRESTKKFSTRTVKFLQSISKRFWWTRTVMRE